MQRIPFSLSALNEGRSLNSGDTLNRISFPIHAYTLNEGRSLNSGDTPKRDGVGSARDDTATIRSTSYRLDGGIARRGAISQDDGTNPLSLHAMFR